MLPLVFLFVLLLFVGGIIFAGIKIHDLLHKPSADADETSMQMVPSAPVPESATPVSPQVNPEPPGAQATPAAPNIAAPAPVPDVPPLNPTAPPMAASAEATQPMAANMPPVVDVPLPPPPILDDYVAATSGSPVVMRGRGLAAVDHVQLISTAGAATPMPRFFKSSTAR